jgi:hypothetical protein
MEDNMQFSKDAKIENTVSTDELRPALKHVFFTGTHLIATDGVSLAKIPATSDDGDTPGYIQPQVFKEARKASKGFAFCTMAVNGCIRLQNGTQYERTKEDPQYPNVQQIIDPAADNQGTRVAINAALLLKLAQALGSDTVELVLPEQKGVTRAIAVYPIDSEKYSKTSKRGEGIGLIMPVRLPEL